MSKAPGEAVEGFDDLTVEFLSMYDALDDLAIDMWRLIGVIIRDHIEIFETGDDITDIGLWAERIGDKQARYSDMAVLADHSAEDVRIRMERDNRE